VAKSETEIKRIRPEGLRREGDPPRVVRWDTRRSARDAAQDNGHGEKGIGSLAFDFGGTWSEIENRRIDLAGATGITKPFYENWLVYIAAKFRAAAVASVKLDIFNRNPEHFRDAARVPDTDEVAKLILKRPNNHQAARTFRRAGAIHQSLDGEDIWFLMDNNGKPVGGEDLDPPGGVQRDIDAPVNILSWRGSAIKLMVDDFGFPSRWRYPRISSSGKEIWWPAHSVIQFAGYDPYIPVRGFGDVEALTRQLDLYFQAERFIEGGLRNGGDYGGWIVTKHDVDESTARNTQASLDDEARSAGKNRRWKALYGDVEVKPNSASPKDMEYGQLLARLDRAISSVMGVSLPLLGIMHDIKFTNFEWSIDQFWRGGNGILSYLCEYEDTLNTFFFPRLKGKESQYYARFDRESISALQRDMTERYKAAATIAASEIGVSYAEALKQLELPFEEGDLAYGQLHFIGQRTALEDKGKDDGEEEEPEEEPKPDEEDEGTPASEEEAARQAYQKRFDELIFAVHEEKLRKSTLQYLRSYERAQITRLQSYAKPTKGKAARKTEPGELIEALLEPLLLNREEWDEKLIGKLSPAIEAAFFAAAMDIASELGGILLGPEDPTVIAVLRTRLAKLADDVNSTLAKRVRKALVDVMSAHPTSTTALQEIINELLPELTAKLRAVFATKEARALTIARTETAIASNTARFMEMKMNGILSHTWITAGDDKVRERHAAINGRSVPIGTEFIAGTNLKYPSDPEALDPALIVNCFVPETEVSGSFIAGSKVRYTGPVRQLQTRNGHRLTVTPNHPVLTEDGWIAAGELEKGVRLLGYSNEREVPSVVRSNDSKHCPTTIEDAFQTLAVYGTHFSSRVRAVDFHSDAAFAHGDVHVVALNGELRRYTPAAFAQGVGDFNFMQTDSGEVSHHSFGAFDFSFEGVGGSSTRVPSGTALAFNGGTTFLESPPLEVLRLGLASDWDTGLFERARQGGSTAAKLIRKLFHASAGLVAFDELIEVGEDHFSGHVYDLQALGGWMLAQGIVCSNCRCVSQPD